MISDGVNVSLALKKVHVDIAVEGAIDACENLSHQPPCLWRGGVGSEDWQSKSKR